ncbi:MAG: hypothetical protein ACRDQ5_11545 [Sciscionella sp.]
MSGLPGWAAFKPFAILTLAVITSCCTASESTSLACTSSLRARCTDRAAVSSRRIESTRCCTCSSGITVSPTMAAAPAWLGLWAQPVSKPTIARNPIRTAARRRMAVVTPSPSHAAAFAPLPGVDTGII